VIAARVIGFKQALLCRSPSEHPHPSSTASSPLSQFQSRWTFKEPTFRPALYRFRTHRARLVVKLMRREWKHLPQDPGVRAARLNGSLHRGRSPPV
jgi:hypothetical protein